MHTPLSLAGKRVTVMGLGLHGGAIGTVRWLAEQGARVTATDLKGADELRASVKKLRDLVGVEFVLGEHRDADFREVDLVVRNPAVPRDSKYLQIAQAAGVPIEMDSSLFFAACPSRNIIGVTGSKGKTTCARAITRLLKEAAGLKSVIEVGTDGISPLAELKSITPKTTIVFELSSWRLEALAERRISPPTAVVTSLYRDHLNTYSSFEDYAQAKKAIMLHQDSGGRLLLNTDDPKVAGWAGEAPGSVMWFSLRDLPEGDGIFVREGMITIRAKEAEEVLFDLSSVHMPGDHARRNVLPGLLLASLAGAVPERLKYALEQLPPLPHRLEAVRKLDGVIYINDSAATMPDATIAALKSLAGRRIVHILGGGDKALIFDELAGAEPAANIRTLIFLPGSATEKVKSALTAAYG
ncbi:MAG TPA: UDP-N-acetylmuramoyl-L-alanine--D-glutamate ligase, partial [Candidatus Andersenbacteria bacterium]|nr:UDP-N-acetylmuramoyl-L-alanine--D-glutamate ligase [Candidatus Andersenbacteria bacterium]